jgi:pyruvate-ferredoxin/flavodoxin oxidoreductase
MGKTMKTMDGNGAASHVAYAFTEVSAIYPITPSSTMAENADEWAAHGKKNIFGETVKLFEMQSEAAAAGAVHGSLQAGALTTTFTASQGLLLMIPNMYKIAGELLPGVLHVTARTIASHALSIFGDHSDVYATRQTGFALLASGSVQEVMDIAGVAHLAALSSRVPFLHFFDGFRTSHEIQKIETIEYDEFAKLVDQKALSEFRARALNPENPVTRGTAQNPDVFFQAREACNGYYDAVPDIVNDYMSKISKLTGRDYKPFTYFGAADAENVVVAMGSITDTLKDTVDFLTKKGEKVGLVVVHLFRPFSTKYLFNVMPKTVKRIAVLDRSKEPGAEGEALYLDIKSAFYGKDKQPLIVGGRYGLSSKDTTPSMMLSVFDNLKTKEPKNGFTVGIVDDVTFHSLPLNSEEISVLPEGTVECKFYGLGSDGTVGANKNSIKIIGDHTDMYAQGYFAYDSKKSGGVTVSHLRFGKKPIRAPYLVNQPDFVQCSVPAYIGQYDMLKGIKKGGTFLLNSIWDAEETVKRLPDYVKKQLADNDVKFYILNATKVAAEIGLPGRTNTIMQSAFFRLANVISPEDAVKYMKEAIQKSYGKKGADVVNKNNAAVDKGSGEVVKIEVSADWKKLSSAIEGISGDYPTFVTKIAYPVNHLNGDSLPVSAFMDQVDGTIPAGTAAFEKRGIAVNVPEWQAANCIQCNQCAYVCPHAVIRPFLLSADEQKKAPAGYETIKAVGKGLEDHTFRMQISPLDCTGCGNCADVCPAKTKALVMKPLDSQKANEANWDWTIKNVTYKSSLMPTSTVKGSQFAQPLFEFHGACAGCGETPYLKLITQLYGDRMMIANATGCSSIYGGSYPASPYCKNAEGKGPAWANSLFEDNAEYGFGFNLAVTKMRDRIERLMKESGATGAAKEAFDAWIAAKYDGERSKEASKKVEEVLAKESAAWAKPILDLKKFFIKKSIWIFGGDGWAYDIGYGGVDHVLSTGEDVNIFVVDTEVYSNTGGQSSKSTPVAAIAKFAAQGKRVRKKDLGLMATTYGYVYVAQVAIGANQNQYIKALQEAEAYPGPSLIIAYSPCINHGPKAGMGKSQAEGKKAVESGYWHLWRYNPLLEKEGKNPFQLDSKEPNWAEFQNFLAGEVRYTSLKLEFPDVAGSLFGAAEDNAKWRYATYKRLSEAKYGA